VDFPTSRMALLWTCFRATKLSEPSGASRLNQQFTFTLRLLLHKYRIDAPLEHMSLPVE